jgi:hypothetical protein
MECKLKVVFPGILLQNQHGDAEAPVTTREVKGQTSTTVELAHGHLAYCTHTRDKKYIPREGLSHLVNALSARFAPKYTLITLTQV